MINHLIIIIKNIMQQKIEEVNKMQMLMGGEQSLSPHELIIAGIHSLNLYHKL